MTCPSLPASNLYLPCVRTCRHAIGRRRWNENQLCDILEPRAVKKSRKLLAAAAEIHIFQTDMSTVPCFYIFYEWKDRVGAIWDHVSCLNSFINWNCEIPKFLAAEEFPHGDSALTAPPPPEPPPVALFSHNLSTSSGLRPAKYAAVMKWGETLKIRERIGMEGLTMWQNELYCRLCELFFIPSPLVYQPCALLTRQAMGTQNNYLPNFTLQFILWYSESM